MKRRPALVGGLPRLGPHELVLVLGCVHLLLDLVQVGVGDCLVAVEDLGDLLEGRAPGLDVEEPHKDELHRVPEGVEQHEVPVVGHVVPGELVGLAVVKKKRNLLALICVISLGWRSRHQKGTKHTFQEPG